MADFPIFPDLSNFAAGVQWGIARKVDFNPVGNAIEVLPRGLRAAFSCTIPVTCQSRPAARRIRNFFESRRGQLLPFFLINPMEDFGSPEIVAGGVEVDNDGVDLDWDAVKYIGAVYADGTVDVRAVESSSVTAGRRTLATATDFADGAIRLTTAFLVRFASDTLDENFLSGTVSTTDLSVVELPEEV